MSFTTFHRQCAYNFQGVRELTTFLPCFILMRSPDFAGQGHLTPFSTGQLKAYKNKILNNAVEFYIPLWQFDTDVTDNHLLITISHYCGQ